MSWHPLAVGWCCRGQKEITTDAHDLHDEHNRVSGNQHNTLPGVFVEPSARQIYMIDYIFECCTPEIQADPVSPTDTSPSIACGCEAVADEDSRHLRY